MAVVSEEEKIGFQIDEVKIQYESRTGKVLYL